MVRYMKMYLYIYICCLYTKISAIISFLEVKKSYIFFDNKMLPVLL